MQFVVCGVGIVGVTNLKANRKDWLRDSPWTSEEQFMEDLINEWENMKNIGIQKGILTKNSDGSIVGLGHPDNWFDEVERNTNVKNSR